MKNATVHKVAKGSAPAFRDTTYWKWLGWMDVKAGVGFRKEYDQAEEHLQRNYEAGRALAVVTLTEWGMVPAWNKNQKMQTAMDRAELENDVWDALRAENRWHTRGK